VKLFVGLEIPVAVRKAIVERTERIRGSLPHASWVAPDDYHLLLAFLGEGKDGDLQGVNEALSCAFASRESFEIQLAGAGSFPPMRPARVLWIGVEEKAALERLHRVVWDGLTRVVDVEPDWKPFHAHSTVARCRKPWTRRCVDVWCQACSGRIGGPFRVQRGALFSSEPDRQISRYRVIETFPMKGYP
jgi:2'-5' RNA ligase